MSRRMRKAVAKRPAGYTASCYVNVSGGGITEGTLTILFDWDYLPAGGQFLVWCVSNTTPKRVIARVPYEGGSSKQLDVVGSWEQAQTVWIEMRDGQGELMARSNRYEYIQ